MTTGAPPTGSDGPLPGPRPRLRTPSLAAAVTEAERSAGRGEPDTGWLELPNPDDHPLPREHARSPDVAALLRRTVRWVAITALVYRVVAPPSSVAGYMGAVGPSHAVAVIVVATVVTLATAAFLAALASGRARDLLWSRAFFLADIGVGAALNLWAAASLPARTLDQPFRDVFWYYLIGATGMWVAVRGVRAGLLVVGVSAPLQVAMCLVNGLALDTHVVAQMLARSLWLVLSIVVGSVILPLLRLGTRLALAEGLHTGQKVEQARLNRAMHDTVLQTLEAIALRAGDEHEAPADRLREVRAAARRQADELRRVLRDDATAVTDLAAALRALAEEFAGLGLRVELVTAELGREPLSVEVEALRDAVREALANTWKHAGARRAVVRAVSHPDRVEVSVRDLGRGFDRRAGVGFGITQSIVGRMREMGGGADVWSAPGGGTRVVAWVPR